MQSMKPGSAPTDHEDARRWVPVLAGYRDPSRRRSLFELSVSLVPFLGLWALAWWSLSISPWLAGRIAVLNGGFLVRLFAIQHDCGHGSFFPDRWANDALGRALGVLTLTPYDVWKRTHSIHHSTAGNLDRRDLGDIETLTVREYREPDRRSGGCATGSTAIRSCSSASARATCFSSRTACRSA
jgi:acyl-lipid omega-6 desaturase (Delta-12 desaturase)